MATDNKGTQDKGNKGGSTNRGGLRMEDLYKGLTRYKIDGGISIAAQGDSLVAKELELKLRREQASLPGAMIIDFLPLIGSSDRVDTFASLADQGDNLWQTVRSATPHAENYQSGDIMCLLTGISSLRYGLADTERALRSLYWFIEDNSYAPDGFWRMLTNITDPTRRRSMYTDQFVSLVNKYNGIIYTLRTKKIPDVFPVFHRWANLARVGYRDNQNEKRAQFYFFHPTHVYDFQPRPEEDPGMDLIPRSLPDLIDAKLDLLEELATKYTSDSAFNGMYADLVLAFPESQTMRWDTLDDKVLQKEGIKTEYNLDVLNALHNATICRMNAPIYHIVPTTGTIIGDMYAQYGKLDTCINPPTQEALLDKPMDDKRFMNDTQWVVWDPQAIWDTHSIGCKIVNTPLEVLTNMRTYWWRWDLDGSNRAMHVSVNMGNAEWAYANTDVDYPDWEFTGIVMSDLWSTFTFAYAPMQRWYFVQFKPNITEDTCSGLEDIVKVVQFGEATELQAPYIPTKKQVSQAHDAARVGAWNIPLEVINGKRNGNR